MKPLYKSSLIGCGRIAIGLNGALVDGQNPSHAAAYCNNPRISLIAAADNDNGRLTCAQKEWGIKRLYKDHKLMLKCEAMDIVSICAPTQTHYDILKDCIEYPVKAIWCEKPICDDADKAKEVLGLCRKKKIVLAVNYFRRWSLSHQKARAFIQEGNLGDIQRIICCYSKGLLNNGSHIIDIMHFFFGNIRWVESYSSFSEGQRQDRSLSARLYFQKGFTATLYAFNDDYFRIIEIDIVGTRGRIRIKDSGDIFEYYGLRKHPRVSSLKALGKPKCIDYRSEFMQPMNAALEDLICCIEDKKRRPLCSGEDALKALVVVEAIKESFRKKGRRIRIENKQG